MKCVKCGHEGAHTDFRYLYNARIDASIAVRQCPKCGAWNSVDELTGEAGIEVVAGGAPWGKSSGVEGLAEDTAEVAAAKEAAADDTG